MPKLARNAAFIWDRYFFPQYLFSTNWNFQPELGPIKMPTGFQFQSDGRCSPCKTHDISAEGPDREKDQCGSEGITYSHECSIQVALFIITTLFLASEYQAFECSPDWLNLESVERSTNTSTRQIVGDWLSQRLRTQNKEVEKERKTRAVCRRKTDRREPWTSLSRVW